MAFSACFMYEKKSVSVLHIFKNFSGILYKLLLTQSWLSVSHILYLGLDLSKEDSGLVLLIVEHVKSKGSSEPKSGLINSGLYRELSAG